MTHLLQTYLGDILHVVSQLLLVPVVVGLLLFIGYALWSIGSLVAETLTTHRGFRAVMPRLLADMEAAGVEDMPDVLARSGLLNRQIVALLTLWDYRVLPEEAHVALAKRLLSNESLRYGRITGRNEGAAKLAPMLGLMGTLIPLGPGIAAMSSANLDLLASSLLIAFDTTIAGLAAAFVCFIVAKIRKNRYKGYMVALESAMTTMIDKVNHLRDEGDVGAQKPTCHAEEFAQAVGVRHVRDERTAHAIAEKASLPAARSEGGGR